MPVSVVTAATGFRELGRKLDQRPPFHVPAVRKAQRNLANLGARLLRARSTKLTGKLRKSIRPTTGRGMFAAVLFDPVASQGRGKGAQFRSAWAFDASSKFRPRHGGQTTRWVQDVPPEMQDATASELAAAGEAIEAAWRSD